MAKTVVQELFESPVNVDETSLSSDQPNEKIPAYGRQGWNDYILSKLLDDEWVTFKINGKDSKYPKSVGFKRLIVEYLGEIIESQSRLVAVPTQENNFTSIIEHFLVIDFYNGGGKRVFQGVGAINKENTQKPYCLFGPETASSKAAGRAYRDALCVSVCVAEEMAPPPEERNDDDDEITDAQKTALSMMTKKLRIDPNRFINMGQYCYGEIEDISKGVARKMIKKLNDYQSNLSSIPSDILKKVGE